MKLVAAFLIVAAVVAVSPALFWMRYGTLDACDAYAGALQQREVASATDDMTRLAARVGGRFLAAGELAAQGATHGDCLKGLWKLETGS